MSTNGAATFRLASCPACWWRFVLAGGATRGRHVPKGTEEIYYVMNGEGAVTVGSETEKLGPWDAVPIRVNEVHSFENTGTRDLEFMVVGVALEKGKPDSEDVKE